ncbi:SPASM domain-containing protein [Acinetobacter baumannii]|uniref:radical SAM/SPASM domain-containing protein n=1 Tax=Acinetobacter genomosp. 33YU TaxID=1675530 RepID=UPI00097F7225|nr:radical SAM/SPASM domain-containing protein [Acinetobacter genomosp. 33YU]ONN58995.1 Fe-S oxidoreductase [Acinetobacter genomosp. 33YU]
MKLPLVMNVFYRFFADNFPEPYKPDTRGLYNKLNKIVTYGYKNRDIFTAIDFEINSQCNLECSYCPSSFKNGRGENYMSEDTYRKVIDDLALMNYKGRVSPHFFGEPLLDKRLPKLIGYARSKLAEADIVIHTNGIKLNESSYVELIKAGVSGFLVTQHTKKMPKVFLETFDKFKNDGKIILRSLNNKTLFNRAGTIDYEKSRKMTRCYYLSDEISITHKGNVVCTNDFHESHSFGNVNDTSLKDIWHSPYFKKIRTDVQKGIFELEMCKKCTGTSTLIKVMNID